MPQTAILKKPVPGKADWHWADVMAAIRKRGWSLRQIAEKEGYAHGNVLGEAARRPYPKAEAILASYAGVTHPMLIWPSRYTADGQTARPMGRPKLRGQAPVKRITPLRSGNPQTRRPE